MILTAIAAICAAATGSTIAQARRENVSSGRIQQVICLVFREHCLEALEVAWCESRFNMWAQNGQYHYLFQMGSHERDKYGDRSDLWGQVKAAHRYFVASGQDWSPWSCKPH